MIGNEHIPRMCGLSVELTWDAAWWRQLAREREAWKRVFQLTPGAGQDQYARGNGPGNIPEDAQTYQA
ncbi:hypothetical protein BDZ89DRAFT_1066400 [Hymenopellis radicata]|nr:hypothetical protein BDZ89DRAFT_1066400 [Hymenopellis radicata]